MGNTLYDKMFVSIGKTVPSAQVWQIELIAKATEQTAIQAQIDLLKNLAIKILNSARNSKVPEGYNYNEGILNTAKTIEKEIQELEKKIA